MNKLLKPLEDRDEQREILIFKHIQLVAVCAEPLNAIGVLKPSSKEHTGYLKEYK